MNDQDRNTIINQYKYMSQAVDLVLVKVVLHRAMTDLEARDPQVCSTQTTPAIGDLIHWLMCGIQHLLAGTLNMESSALVSLVTPEL